MMVKICGITNREDALAAVEAGASAVGFNFWPGSPRYIAPAFAAEIAAALPKSVLRVGVFVDASAVEVKAIAREVGLDVAQTHGRSERPAGVRWWPAFSAGESPPAFDGAEAFLVDTPAGEQRGGTGRVFDWSLAAGLPGRIVLAGGLAPENVAAAIRQARPWGVDACSRLELSPGRKDHQRVRAFVRAALSETL